MNKEIVSLVLSVIFLSIHVESAFASEKLRQAIEKIIAQSRVSKDKLGIVIGTSGETEDRLFELNSQKRMIPASLTKVITAGAVLEKMPIGHQFITSLVSDGKIEGDTLKGDLVLRGGGDAGFVSETMWVLVNEFRRNEVTKITGDIVVDDTFFDDVRFDSGRDDVRVDRAYDAPIGAMTFNWSTATVYVRPSKIGDKPKVFLDPVTDYLKLDNKAKVVKGSRNNLAISRVPGVDKKSEVIMVRGEIGVDSKEVVVYKSIYDPALWSGYNLKEFLRQRGINVEGSVRVGKAPEKAAVLAQVKSKPLAAHVADMMKYSNNYVAEILAKNLAVHVHGAPGTMEKGLGQIKEYLRGMGITDFELTSPSGLSRRNEMRPVDIFKVLSHLKGNFKVFPEHLSSMPIMGVDGTLRRRMPSSGAFAQVRAKTGHLSGVAGLAGYLGKTDEQQLTFVFMYNGTATEAVKASELYDKIILKLLE